MVRYETIDSYTEKKRDRTVQFYCLYTPVGFNQHKPLILHFPVISHTALASLLKRRSYRTRFKLAGTRGFSVMGKTRKNFYAVRVGREVGVYNSWEDCRAQVDRYPGAVFKGFSDSSEAQSFVGASRASCARSTYGRSSSYHSSHVPTQPRYRKQYVEPTSSVSYHQSSSAGSWSGSYHQPHSSLSACSTQPLPSSLPSRGHGAKTTASRTLPTVYSDGCCFNNGRAGARAGIGVYWEADSPHNVSEKLSGPQTNQRAELVAACRAVQSAIDCGHSAVEVRTDSSYTIKAMTEWLDKWKRNGWQTSQAGPVKNKEDIVQLDNACQKIDVKWTHVPGHRGVAGNEAADQLAKAGSLQ